MPKIQTRKELEAHISKHCTEHGLTVTWATFVDCMEMGVNNIAMSKLFHTNHQTMTKWRRIYTANK